MSTQLPTIGAIPTIYRGIRFRSRLEARWAVFFDRRGWSWEHEPEGYSDGKISYLPDFWLPDERMFWEVKRDVYSLSEDELEGVLEKAEMLVQLTERGCAISFGFPTGSPDDIGKMCILHPGTTQPEIILWRDLGYESYLAAKASRLYQLWEPAS